MKKRRFADTDIELGAIGLGTMPLSGAYSDVTVEEGHALLEYCLELGIDLWDAANIYTNGVIHSEEVMAGVLKDNRSKVFVATKVGYVQKPGVTSGYQKGGHVIDCRPETLRQETEKCLRRLNVDTIDLMYMHRVDPEVPIEESIGALSEMVKEGKIRFLGLSECKVEDVKRADTVYKISAVENRHSFVHREVEAEMLPYLKQTNKTQVSFRCLAAGMLTEDTPFTRALKEFAAGKQATLSQLAFAWALAQGENCIPIQGTKNKARLLENAKAVDIVLTPQDLLEIDDIIEKYMDRSVNWG